MLIGSEILYEYMIIREKRVKKINVVPFPSYQHFQPDV
jgi:hypothetical protein